MIRFFAVSLWEHPAMQQYKYYFRLDSDSFLLSRLWSDPFGFFAKNDFKFGFVATTTESRDFTHDLVSARLESLNGQTELARLRVPLTVEACLPITSYFADQSQQRCRKPTNIKKALTTNQTTKPSRYTKASTKSDNKDQADASTPHFRQSLGTIFGMPACL